MAQVCFDSTAFYTVLIISMGIMIYSLTHVPVPVTVEAARTQTPLSKPRPEVPLSVIYDIQMDNERRYETERFLHPMIPPLRRGPFNLGNGGRNPNRYGYNGAYNQMGYLLNKDNNDQAMPLMGRRLHSQQYEYYTFHHNNPEIKIPIKINGDKEILNGDTVNVTNYPPDLFKATIYDLDTPRYVPY